MKRFRTAAVLALFLCSVGSQSYARRKRDWTYAGLLKEADLVVIVNAVETKAVPNSGKLPSEAYVVAGGSVATMIQQVETTFRVQAVIKGQSEGKALVLVHFRWKTPEDKAKEERQATSQFTFIRNGPSFVEFPNRFFDAMLGKTVNTGADCLLFLKVRKDGKCEPISGQVDPDDSVRWLTKWREPQPNSQQPQGPTSSGQLR